MDKEDTIITRVLGINKHLLEGFTIENIPLTKKECLEWVAQQSSNCQKCILADNRTTVVRADGDHNARIMLIAEGPGFLEDGTGLPFVGTMELKSSRCGQCINHPKCYSHRMLKTLDSRMGANRLLKCSPNLTSEQLMVEEFFVRSAGSILDGIILKKYGMKYPRKNWIDLYNRLHPDEKTNLVSPWFMTNIVMCRSFDKNTLKDTPPQSIPKNACKPWLVLQWAALQPAIIVALGRPALATLVGDEKKAALYYPGDIIETKFGKVIFAYHPAFYMREPSKETRALGYAKTSEILTTALTIAGYENV